MVSPSRQARPVHDDGREENPRPLQRQRRNEEEEAEERIAEAEETRKICPNCAATLRGTPSGCDFEVHRERLMEVGHEVIAEGRDDLVPKQIRFPMYQEFIFLTWGKLGLRNREQIYVCVNERIRDEFPNTFLDGDYVGFREAAGTDDG